MDLDESASTVTRHCVVPHEWNVTSRDPVTAVTGKSPVPQYLVPMHPQSCPVCGDSSLAQIKRPDGFLANDAHPVQTAVLAYRCKSGHVFSRREVIYDKAPDPSPTPKSSVR